MSVPMRHLLRLIHSLNPAAGGTVEAIRQVSPLLAERDVVTTVACLDAPDAPWLQNSPDKGYRAIGLGPGRGTYGYAPGVIATLQKLIVDADAVVIEGLWQYHAFAAWRAMRRLGPQAPPFWVYPHGMLDPWFNRTYPVKKFKKWLYWPWADYRILRDARAVLFTTDQERLLARQSFWLYRARERVAPFGIMPPPAECETQKRAFRQAYPSLSGKPFLLSLARLQEKKGLDLLVGAFASIAARQPDLQLMLAGADGGAAAALRHQAQQLRIADRVIMPGLLQGPLKWGALRHCELFCLPSHQENFGIAVVEALACARPVLISTAVNISDEVAASAAGLVQADTLAATTTALLNWLDLPQTQRRTMGQSALTLFEQRYRLDHRVEDLLAIFNT